MNKVDDDREKLVDAEAPSSGSICPGDHSDNVEGEGKENIQGGENRTGKRKGTKNGKGIRKTTED
jgi:hypothetical protein